MKINSFNTLVTWLAKFTAPSLRFRGQCDSNWELNSSLTRAVKSNQILESSELLCETYLLREFRSCAHLYDQTFHIYKDSDLSILSYAQHHGSPTKLLDITSSKFLALFFAFENIDLFEKPNYSRIWYFDKNELLKRTSELLGIDFSDFKDFNTEDTYREYINNSNDFLFILDPIHQTQRIHIQKGGFICPGSINKSINDIYKKDYMGIIKYVDINQKLYKDVFDYLFSMNISNKTIYGGIDGFAKDIKNEFINLHYNN